MDDLCLRTERLVITPARPADLDELMALENADEVRDFVWQGTREEHLREIADPDVELLVARAPEGHRLAGYALVAVDRRSHRYELRRLAVRERGRGHGGEMIEALMAHAFEDLGTHRFWLDVYPHNERGIRLYERLGMHRDGVMRGNYLAADGYRDQIIYSMLATEWDQGGTVRGSSSL